MYYMLYTVNKDIDMYKSYEHDAFNANIHVYCMYNT